MPDLTFAPGFWRQVMAIADGNTQIYNGVAEACMYHLFLHGGLCVIGSHHQCKKSTFLWIITRLLILIIRSKMKAF